LHVRLNRQRKFTDLSGTTEAHGDLKSVVLHSMTLSNVSSDFDVPIGVKISGVDASTYSVTGEAFSAVISPKSTSDVARVLQADDVSLGERRATHHPHDSCHVVGIYKVLTASCLFLRSQPMNLAVNFQAVSH
jgi:hypothetical protein